MFQHVLVLTRLHYQITIACSWLKQQTWQSHGDCISCTAFLSPESREDARTMIMIFLTVGNMFGHTGIYFLK